MTASSEASAILEARGVDLVVGDRVLVRSLDLQVRAAERWCMLGPNGSGKSTLLRSLAGVAPPTRGEVRLCGTAYARLDKRRAALRRAFLPQDEGCAFRIRVRECVLLGRHPHLGRFGWPGREDLACVEDAIAAMDLSSIADRDVQSLSGGEQQRTRLAALLAQMPQLFLLDEPTTHLDLRHQAALFEHLALLCEREGRSVLFATHELNIAARFATHALVFGTDGRVACGPAAEVLDAGFLSNVFGFPIVATAVADRKAFVPQW